jgi:predicted nuclease of predicted toxin-antitoxin system
MIVTLDADFHALLAISGAKLPSVVRLRVEGLRARPLVDLILRIVEDYGEELELGAVLTVQANRIRRLPLIVE